MTKAISISVFGKVQGVFFRASTKEKADELMIRGFVKNEPDGSVYIEAEGGEEEINLFVEWCQSGPPGARVERVNVLEAEPKLFSGFEIRRF